MTVAFGRDEFECEAKVMEAATPSFAVGDKLIQELWAAGWQLNEGSWLLDDGEELVEAREGERHWEFGDMGDLQEQDMQGCGYDAGAGVEEEEFW